MVTYCTATQVANFLQISAFDGSSTPSLTQVEDIIERKEDKIDDRTGHSWRERTVTDEYLRPSTVNRLGTGIRFKLKHRKIRAITKLERWDGSQWYDYVASGTEGRNADYWTNKTDGVVFINGVFSVFDEGVRATYTYGETTVNADIEEACVLFTAIDVLGMYDQQVNFVEDGGTINQPKSDKIQKWEDRANSILSDKAEIVMIG